MGREIKRVALDFNWPMEQPWKGFINPYHSQECRQCKGRGYNPETQQIEEDWYAFGNDQNRWCDKLTQDEVDALVAEGRLYDFTHVWERGSGWQPIVPQPVVTAQMVNEWSRGGSGHDAINRMICVEIRARRLGVFGYCMACDGQGEIWFSEKVRQLHDEWDEKERYEPPSGEGWQVWETVSEGSPVTPVFASKKELADHLANVGDSSDIRRGEGGWGREAADSFVSRAWAPSMVNGARPRDGQPGEE